MGIANTGGFDPVQLNKVRTANDNIGITGGYDPNELSKIRTSQDSLGGSEGYGREGYQSLADTGGYTDEQKTAFLESSMAPVRAAYSRNHDEAGRRLAIQGGYSPGFDSGMDRMARHETQDLSQANLTGRVNLDSAIQNNKLAGLGGLERTRSAMGSEKLAGINSKIGLESNVAGNKIGANNANASLESSVAQGKIAGQDALQRYLNTGIAALNQNDILTLQNRLQSGQMSQADAQLLEHLAAQQKSTYDQIMQGVQVGAGAVAGIAGAF